LELNLTLKLDPAVPRAVDFEVIRDGRAETLGSGRDWTFMRVSANDLLHLRGRWPADQSELIVRPRTGGADGQGPWQRCVRDWKRRDLPWEISLHSDAIRLAIGGAVQGSKPEGRLEFELELVDIFQNRKSYPYTLLVNWVPRETILHRGITWRHAVDNVFVSDEVSFEMLEKARSESPDLSAEARAEVEKWIEKLRPDHDSTKQGGLPVVGLSCDEALEIAQLLGWRLPTLTEWLGTVDEAVKGASERHAGAPEKLYESIVQEENLRANRYGPHEAVRNARNETGQNLFVPVSYPTIQPGPAGGESSEVDSVDGTPRASGPGEEVLAFRGLRQLLGNVREYVVEYEDPRSPIASLKISKGWIAGANYDTLLLYKPPPDPSQEKSPVAGTLWFLDRRGIVAFEGLKSQVDPAPPGPLKGARRPVDLQWTGFRFAIAAGEGTDTKFDGKFRELARRTAEEGGDTR
jgi:hypothetical protein